MDFYKSQNFKDLSHKTLRLFVNNNNIRRSLDGLSNPRQSRHVLATACMPNFVLVGNSYTVVDSIIHSNKFVDDIVDISNLFFADAQTYTTFLLSRSRIVFLCFHSLAISFSRSPIVHILAVMSDTLLAIGKSTNTQVIGALDTLVDALDSILSSLDSLAAFIQDDIAPHILDLCISALKTARRIWSLILKASVVPVVGVLGLSIASTPVLAAGTYTDFRGENAIENINSVVNLSQNSSQGLALQSLTVSDSTYSMIDFSGVKEDLAKAAKKGVYRNIGQKQSTYIFTLGDTISKLALRWENTRENIALSNLAIQTYGIEPSSLIGTKIIQPEKETVSVIVNKDITINDIAAALNTQTEELLNIQYDTSRLEYFEGDSINISSIDVIDLTTELGILRDAGYISDEYNTIETIRSDVQSRIDRQKEEERLRKEEEERVRLEEEEKQAQEQKRLEAEAAKKKINTTTRSTANTPQITTSSTMVWPTTGRMSRCNLRYHLACDIANRVGTPIVAFRKGVVTYAGWKSGGYGNMVQIDHGNGLSSIYMHLSSVSVRSGQAVAAGTYLGGMGSTGNSTGSHLHFGLFINGVEISPYRYLTWR